MKDRRVGFMNWALLALAAASLLASCTEQDPVWSDFLLDTLCSVTVYGRVRSGLETRIFRRGREIEARMGLFDPRSEISAVNRSAGTGGVRVSEDTLRVVDAALKCAELSDGGFDPTVGPLTILWNIGNGGEHAPAAAQIRAARSLVDRRGVTIDADRRTIALARPGMALDLGGIAKGYACDEAARILKEARVSAAIVDFGGNLAFIGRKPDGTPWRVGVQLPFADRGQLLGRLNVKAGDPPWPKAEGSADDGFAVATSGIYERYFKENGRVYHHIMDPGTGFPADNGLAAVTVFARDAMDADALSTAIFILGPLAGFERAESLPRVEALFVGIDDTIRLTSGLRGPGRFELLNVQYRLQPT
jgi:thiamine biosynthesis lipoprotein